MSHRFTSAWSATNSSSTTELRFFLDSLRRMPVSFFYVWGLIRRESYPYGLGFPK